MAVDVPMIWCLDTWGQPSVEASSVGAHASMNSSVTHPNYPIQVDSLVLPRNLQPDWTGNSFTVAGDDFLLGFWIYIANANMGGAFDQDILEIYTDGGTSPDIILNHQSGWPTGGDYNWRIKDTAGVVQGSVNKPFNEGEWKWCTLFYERHDTQGVATLYVWSNWPSLAHSGKLFIVGNDFKAAGAGSSMFIKWHGHQDVVAGGSMAIRVGGMYLMDGTDRLTAKDDQLSHRAFHSLRPEKDSVTPDVKWNGLSPDPSDDLDAGLWKDLGDFDWLTSGQYTAVAGKGGAVQTEDYNFSTSILNADVNVGKFVYDIGARPASAARYVYGYYDVSAGTYSVANVICSALQFEHVIYSGDLRWPVMTNLAVARAIPVVGFGYVSGTRDVGCAEAAFVKMWPVGAPGAHDAIHLVNNAPVVHSLVNGGLAR